MAKLDRIELSYCLDDSPKTTYSYLRAKIDELPHYLDPEDEQFKDKPKLCKKITELVYRALLAMDFVGVRQDLVQVHLRTSILALLGTVYNFCNSFGLTSYGWLPITIAIIWLHLVYDGRPEKFTILKQDRLGYQSYRSQSGCIEPENIYAWVCTIFL